ncbi:hypothetical protein NPIL_265791, partial [Nephila pilipes]
MMERKAAKIINDKLRSFEERKMTLDLKILFKRPLHN